MPKIQIKVKSVIFDMDGVITNTMPDHFRAWKAVLKKYGIAVVYQDIYTREGQQGLLSVFEIFRDYVQPVTHRLAEGILRQKERLLKRIVKRRFIRGARSFIRQLDQEGFKLGLVTGTARHELEKILPDDLYRMFAVVVTGTDVKNGKPHPEPFLAATKKLKIKASEAIVIENAPFGLTAAKEAGLRCIALQTSLPGKFLRSADFIFKSYAHLKQNIHLIYG